jgi:endonuclease III
MNPNAASLQELLQRLERFYGLLVQPPRDAFALYVWEVLSVYSTPPRRDVAMTALRRIRALTAGADVFRRNPRIPAQLRAPLPEATQAIALLPHLSTASAHWLLLFAGDHPLVPADPRLTRVVLRLGYGEQGDDVGLAVASAQRAVAAELEGDLGLLQQAAIYLTHHGLTTCVQADPHCHVCPLRDACPFPCAPSVHSEGAGL